MTKFNLFLLAICVAMPARADLLVHALNVGYGDCYLLEAQKDGKTTWAALFDVGRPQDGKAISRYLRRHGIDKLDAVFLSHAHPNHFGGLPSLLRKLPVKTFLWAGANYPREGFDEILRELVKASVGVQSVSRSFELAPGDRLSLRILHPEAVAQDPHRDGLVLLVRYGGISFLFAGDLDSSEQPAVLEELERGSVLPSVVTWPHHGDMLSPAWTRWFEKVDWLVVSAGPNRQGLPRVSAYPALQSKILRTDQSEHILISTDGRAVSIQKAGRPSRRPAE